jgi:Na+/H+ antiporter NhaD/arsenite permease-like protein
MAVFYELKKKANLLSLSLYHLSSLFQIYHDCFLSFFLFLFFLLKRHVFSVQPKHKKKKKKSRALRDAAIFFFFFFDLGPSTRI